MVFVPMVAPPRQASARAEDLGRRLKAEVEKFEAQYPGTSPEDLRAAAQIAIGEASSGATPDRRRIAAALGAGLAILGAVFAILFVTKSTGVDSSVPLNAMISAGTLAAAVALIARRLRRR